MKQALFAYNGSVFKTMQTDTIPVADLGYIQDHLRIVSVLYGLLRPLDLIKAYRLAYTLKLKGLNLKNLYEYWLPKLTAPLIGDVKRSGGILINLASLDVWGAFDEKELRAQVRVITSGMAEWKIRNDSYLCQTSQGSDDPLYFASSSRNSGRNNPVRVGGISV